MKHLETRNIALVAVFSALYYVLSFLPGVPLSPEIKVQLEACIASVFGLIFGPYLGALTALIGAFVAWALPPGGMGLSSLIYLPSPMINAFVVGLIYTKRWKGAFITFALLITAFWFTPPMQPINENYFVGIAGTLDKIVALLLIFPTAMLAEKMSQSSIERVKGGSERPRGALFLSVIAAIFMISNAWMIAITGNVIKFQYDNLKMTFGFKDFVRPMASYGFVWIVIGVIVLIGAIMLYVKPEKRVLWGVVVLLFSIPTAIIGGGFIVGLIMGVFGGIFAIVKRKFVLPRRIRIEALFYFLLAFIGNQADNAWGLDIFATPIFYETIWPIPLETVRYLVIIGFFPYLAIRLLQAIIAALIAVPLIPNLKASGLAVLESNVD